MTGDQNGGSSIELAKQEKSEGRHILSLSGGKDSTALAILMRDKVPDLEYVFCDTEKELPETYDYLGRLEAFLGKSINVIKRPGGFDDIYESRNRFLPSPQARWCTEYLKIRPFEQYVGDERCFSYVGIRADENRKGYISTKSSVMPQYPLIELGITKADVLRILKESGLGLPSYYSWRSRSGCYFCFFQQRIEWVGLLEKHPDLFWKAAGYERRDPVTGDSYTWSSRESLLDLARPERITQIKEEYTRRVEYSKEKFRRNQTLFELLNEEEEAEGVRPCLICSL